MLAFLKMNVKKNNDSEQIALFTMTDSDITQWFLIVLRRHRHQLFFNVAVSIGLGTDVGMCEHTFIFSVYATHLFF